MRTRVLLPGVLAALAVVSFTVMPHAVTGSPVAQAPRNLTVLVGGGQDTTELLAFFPMNVRVRQGDTVTWKINADEIHTVTFARGAPPQPNWVQWPLGPGGDLAPPFAIPLPDNNPPTGTTQDPGKYMLNPQVGFPTRFPGAPQEIYSGNSYINSGIMSKVPLAPDAPLLDTLSITFDTPGTYTYACIIHVDRMWGTVEVLPADATSVPDQAAIDAQAQAELAPLLSLAATAKAQGEALPKAEPLANGTTLAHVRSGMTELFSGDGRANMFAFFPQDTTVRVGDTVAWSSTFFHSVTFSPTPIFFEPFVPQPQPEGPPLLALNPRAFSPARPAPSFNPALFYNSADLGAFSPAGYSFSLTFDQPGTYEYQCPFHGDLGMKGTITVLER
jgi:plastocyanin